MRIWFAGMANLHRTVRIVEVVVVGVLGVFAWLTWRELGQLRRFPVSLPSYEFELSDDDESGRVVKTRGTWITERGVPEQLLTIAIECRKAKMECIESAAKVVFVSGRGLLESQQTLFEVDRWNDAEVVTRPSQGPCATRQLVLNLKEKRATTRISPSAEKGLCKELPARTLELVTGYKVRAAPE